MWNQRKESTKLANEKDFVPGPTQTHNPPLVYNIYKYTPGICRCNFFFSSFYQLTFCSHSWIYQLRLKINYGLLLVLFFFALFVARDCRLGGIHQVVHNIFLLCTIFHDFYINVKIVVFFFCFVFVVCFFPALFIR